MSILIAASVRALPPARVDGPSTAATTVDGLRCFAQQAESCGVAFLIIEEPAASLVAASWLIPATRRLGLVASVPVTYTQPFHTARALAAMDTLSRGRMGWLPTTAPAELAPAHGGGAAEDLPTSAGPTAATSTAARSAEYVAATQALWDSWDEDALVIDKHSAVYLDSRKIRRVDYRGKYFQVMGPLNAARPLQGYPVRVQNDDDPTFALTCADADVLIVAVRSPSEARARIATLRASGRARIFVRVHCLSAPAGGDLPAAPEGTPRPALSAIGTPGRIAERLAAWHTELACDGFLLSVAATLEETSRTLELVMEELPHRSLAMAGTPDAATPDTGTPDAGTLRAALNLPVPVNRYSTP